MPNAIRKRLIAALILSPAVFSLYVWMLVLSSGYFLTSAGLVISLLLAAALSFVVSYLITMFLVTLRDDTPTIK